MSASSPNVPANPSTSPASRLPKLDPVKVMFALGSAFRWPVIQLLADGREMSITQGATLTGCTVVNFSKHLGVMLAAGVVNCRRGEDRRQTIFYIPAGRRPEQS